MGVTREELDGRQGAGKRNTIRTEESLKNFKLKNNLNKNILSEYCIMMQEKLHHS